MSMEKSESIVLRTYPWSETSLIVSLFTRDQGKVSVLAKGARRPKSPFEAALDLLSTCSVVFIAKSTDSLDILTEAKLQRRFRAGNRNLLQLYCGYYVAELVDYLTDKGDPQPDVFTLCQRTLNELDTDTQDPRAVILRFELQMLRMTGNLPSLQRCTQCDRSVGNEEQAHDEWTLFSPWAGGVVCTQCRLGVRQLTQISRNIHKTLILFSDPHWENIATNHFPLASQPSQDRSVIRKVITRYLMFLLDRKFNLHPYLEELGR
ncbi:MAG: DNA repair protein RecO [Pirellulaceae bacterium]